MIDQALKNYINSQILPKYSKNNNGHGIDHINYVIDRSMKFAKQIANEPINLNMVYTIAAYHDLGHEVDPQKHEQISANMLISDIQLKQWFTDSQIKIMYDAIVDHRASSDKDPSSIYGKIVSSADRSTSLSDIMTRSYAYHRQKHPSATFDQVAQDAFEHIKAKFGNNGYAVGKMYFDDSDYETFLTQASIATKHFNVFRSIFAEHNNINKKALKMQIEKFQPYNEQEIMDRKTMLDFIDNFADVVTRENIFGHFTASAFVVNSTCTHAVMLHHKIMNDWIYPGGHADGEADLLSVAVREVEEETGLKAKVLDENIYSIQSNPAKGHIKGGKYVSAHLHLDALYLMEADDKIPLVYRDDESKGVKWVYFSEATDETMCDFIRPIHKKLIKKLQTSTNLDKK